LAGRFGFTGERVFGFIGSFYNYEGLELLLESFALAKRQGLEARLLLVGGGPEEEAVRRKAEALGLMGPVILTGKVPHAEVNRYYSLIDVLVYPRLSMRLTELVTPLKPLEAMAMGKIVAGSNVGGIRELVTHEYDGFLFPAGEVDALAKLLRELAGRNDFDAIRQGGFNTVRTKHDWRKAVERYLPVYERLCAE
jgi:glycogen synthase